MEMTEDEKAAPALALIGEGAAARAHSILIEPTAGGGAVRMRHSVPPRPARALDREEYKRLWQSVFELSCLDLAELRLPQDGRIKLRLDAGRMFDVRVTVAPDVRGPCVAMRFCETDQPPLALDALGFDPEPLAQLRQRLAQRHGLIVVAGPRDSGKTTTLHAIAQELVGPEVTVVAFEDPVERFLPGVSHVQCRPGLGLTYAAGLKTMRRQDAEVQLVGELRDYETAELAVQAATSGRLVLTSMSTNDAASTWTRLLAIGLEGYELAGANLTVIAQRLVKTICADCRGEVDASLELVASLGLTADVLPRLDLGELERSRFRFHQGRGCHTCNGAGTRGRTGVFEVLIATDALRSCVLKGGSSADLARQARRDGMRTLYEAALRKAILGTTTLDELAGVSAGRHL